MLVCCGRADGCLEASHCSHDLSFVDFWARSRRTFDWSCLIRNLYLEIFFIKKLFEHIYISMNLRLRYPFWFPLWRGWCPSSKKWMVGGKGFLRWSCFSFHKLKMRPMWILPSFVADIQNLERRNVSPYGKEILPLVTAEEGLVSLRRASGSMVRYI